MRIRGGLVLAIFGTIGATLWCDRWLATCAGEQGGFHEVGDRKLPPPPVRTNVDDQDDDDDEWSKIEEELLDDSKVKELLEKFRQQWEESVELRCHDFQVSLLGGSWTAKHRGVIADAFSGAAKGDRARSWCRSRRMAMSSRCEISLYAEEFASVLARCWCSRMQHLFNIAEKHHNDLHVFLPDELASWPEPSELALAERSLVEVPRAAARIAQIRALI
jgi:hypothetical protein